MTFDLGELAFAGTPPPTDATEEAYAPRRTVLDKIFVDAAVESGAELREGFSVQGLVTDGRRVIGIRGHGRGDLTITEGARLVVGPDGVHSLVARDAQAPEYHAKPPLACWYYTYWSGVPASGIEYYVRPGRAFGVIPTNDGLVCIPTAWTHREFHQYRADIEGNYLRTLELAPGLAERVRQGKREDRFYGRADVPNFLRKPYGPGWVLVGDAGYHKDPITVQGITDALYQAELLSQAVDEGFGGRRPLEEALADYQKRRDDAVLAMYHFTCELAALDPPPPAMQRLFHALRGNQAEADQFVGALAGTVSIPAFFSPENQKRVLGA